MSGFSYQGGDLSTRLISNEELINRYLAGSELWLWGNGTRGNIGNNSIINRSSPVQTVSGGTNWKQVSVGGKEHAAAIKMDGSLWVWGVNTQGQLGTGTTSSGSSPAQTISAGTNWKQVSASKIDATAAIKLDGTLWLWGSGANGQLGNNTIIGVSSPVQTISGGTNWKQVAAGNSHTTALKTDGSLWLWGLGASGQLGNNSVIYRSSPVQTISAGTNWSSVSAGDIFTAAIKTDGSLWLWGRNLYGNLGTNNVIGQSSPVQTISAGTNWKQVSAGGSHVAAIKTDGSLWLWGSGYRGQLGKNYADIEYSASSPIQTISAGTNWRSVAAGDIHTAAIKMDGSLWSWGEGQYGQLGNNFYSIDYAASSPVQTISGGTNWYDVSAGSNYTAALKYLG